MSQRPRRTKGKSGGTVRQKNLALRGRGREGSRSRTPRLRAWFASSRFLISSRLIWRRLIWRSYSALPFSSALISASRTLSLFRSVSTTPTMPLAVRFILSKVWGVIFSSAAFFLPTIFPRKGGRPSRAGHPLPSRGAPTLLYTKDTAVP